MSSRWDTSRTEAFSDGVFAIAITLLVLDIHVPPGSFDHLWRGIAEQWPSYFSFATSFFTIGGLWLAHHGLFGRLRYVDNTVMRLNLLLLLAVSFLPFPTRLMAQAIRDDDAERAAVIFYGTSLLAASIFINAIWRTVAKHKSLLHEEVSDSEIVRIARAATPKLGSYLGVTLIAVFAPRVAAFGYLVIAVVLVLRERGHEARAEAIRA